jgi:hypothetical protein
MVHPANGNTKGMSSGSPAPMPADPPSGQRAFDRTVEALNAVLAFLARVASGLRKLAIASLAAGAVIWLALARHVEGALKEPTTLLLWALLVLACPAALFVVSLALGALRKFPQRVASLPGRVGEHSQELRALAAQARRSAGRSPIRSLVAGIRFWRTAMGTRELFETVAPVRFLFTPWVLGASIIALIGAFIEILVGVVALAWLLLP